MDKSTKKERMAAFKNRPVVGGVYAICNTANNKKMYCFTTDIQGSNNRLEFGQTVGGCVHHRLRTDWDEFGGNVFAFETVEVLEKKASQTDKEFLDDLQALFAITVADRKPEEYR